MLSNIHCYLIYKVYNNIGSVTLQAAARQAIIKLHSAIANVILDPGTVIIIGPLALGTYVTALQYYVTGDLANSTVRRSDLIHFTISNSWRYFTSSTT